MRSTETDGVDLIDRSTSSQFTPPDTNDLGRLASCRTLRIGCYGPTRQNGSVLETRYAATISRTVIEDGDLIGPRAADWYRRHGRPAPQYRTGSFVLVVVVVVFFDLRAGGSGDDDERRYPTSSRLRQLLLLLLLLYPLPPSFVQDLI